MRDNGTGSLPGRKPNSAEDQARAGNGGSGGGQLTVIGIGPGNPENLSQGAVSALLEAEVIVGYRPYLQLLDDRYIRGKQVEGSAMRQEVERAGLAVKIALAGRRVAVISSGDAGVYGMAGLVLETLLADGRKDQVVFRVVPGITAASAAAALLGAPLMHDFAVISLSDLLTPWELIKKRLSAAAAGDFVIVLYNPKSRKRVSQIEEAREIILEHRSPDTPVGIVTGAGRKDERVVVSDLEHFLNEEINMHALVLIGNSQSYVKDGYLITPRGYPIGAGERGEA